MFLEVETVFDSPCNHWKRQISARTSTSPPARLSRGAVAYHVAKTVFKCLHSCGGKFSLPDGTEVQYEDLVVLELVQISSASYQIVLAYLYDLVCDTRDMQFKRSQLGLCILNRSTSDVPGTPR